MDLQVLQLLLGQLPARFQLTVNRCQNVAFVGTLKLVLQMLFELCPLRVLFVLLWLGGVRFPLLPFDPQLHQFQRTVD